jgi:hypothetical protein
MDADLFSVYRRLAAEHELFNIIKQVQMEKFARMENNIEPFPPRRTTDLGFSFRQALCTYDFKSEQVN